MEHFAENPKSKCSHCFAEEKPDTVDNLMENAMNQVNLDPYIEQVKNLVNQVDILEELRDKLLDIYGGIDPVELGSLMQKAFTVAGLAGRYAVGTRSTVSLQSFERHLMKP
ncbi:MAG: hypothetical protein UZ01_03054 [Candidatus Brocadia sinica]|uniref:Choline kinase n=1 Tax=Candidatus Brocadia sinica JPN1 TaxID=1197129 RepID=A0ABQ0K214_9BACT|nr:MULTISPECIES: DUF935 family protein [Brocadia]KXK27531.1 MAG: hypothetical protein UZ01_03054 [Candidatus Brocadia sinica]NOG42779.1 DUF935 family protein [Planctomycetota bacterium]MCK6470014.1 DUF935 domain-containing protein [Candidatus Brocadia sinica]MDL1937301.1 DUF935 family protein [Candidatus Brocadia sp. AMX2]GAN35001.1 choline kinase [Candidatus Brocadia sinica JPN1]